MRFQVVNIGLIISLVINFFISWYFVCILTNDLVAGTLITILIFVVSIGILFTPVGDWWYRRVALPLREPDMMERKRLEPIFNQVYERALEKVPNLSRDIKLFIYEDSGINALAIGLKTIAVYKGILYSNLSDEEIAAVIGHEFAHIANGDTFCTILSIQSNVIVSMFRTVISFLLMVLGKAFGLFSAVFLKGADLTSAEDGFTLGESLIKFCNWILNKIVAAIVIISVMIAQCSRRKHEFMADNFSADLGYGEPMICFFERYRDKDYFEDKFSLSYLLHGTHPSMRARIENLRSRREATEKVF